MELAWLRACGHCRHRLTSWQKFGGTSLHVGRIARCKRIEHRLRALARFRHATGIGPPRLVGSGSEQYQGSLPKLAMRTNIAETATSCERVSPAEQHRLMTSSTPARVMTSMREVWGLVVIQANACGTPAIVYDVPGLRDSVRNEITGLVVPAQPDCLSDAMVRLTSDETLYARLATEGKRWSHTFSFDESARLVGLALKGTLAA